MRIALRRPAVALTLTFAVAAAVPVSAGAITRARSASAFRTQKAADTYVNVDAGKAAAAMRGSSASAVHVSRASRSARAGLVHSLGRQGVFQVDPLTGTPRVLARLDGSLTGPANGDAADLAMRYVRDNLAALGLDAADVAGLRLASRVTSPGGLTVLRWSQEDRGIPSIDHDLRVAVAADGRIISVWGSPAHALSVASVAPGLDALGAARKLQANVHGARAPQVSGAAAGARRATRFRGGDFARLVLFGQGASAHLAWHLTYRRDVNAAFDAVVDADTGQILRRANLVDHASSGLAWDNYPGATFGGAAAGTQQTVDLTPYLTGATPTTLSGPNAHEWADTNDNSGDFPTASDEQPDTGEDIPPSAGTDWLYPFTDFPTGAVGACDPAHQCSWDHTDPTSWQTNRNQNGTQAFYFVNKFHDHLAAAPIGFTAASGNFEGDDPVLVESDDGAATDPGGGPDDSHIDNADFLTPPDGNSPRMQMFLFIHDTDPASPNFDLFRDVNGGDDASIVYHENTHGLSNRLVTDADGAGAVNTPQAGAMGEAWSDWYAKDFLSDQGLQQDTAAPGEVDIGDYTDNTPNTIRSQPLDCPVGAPAAQCPGVPAAGSGGYTYGDFGKVGGGPEVHSDGEIWAETLWDLRGNLPGATVQSRSALAESLITTAMRLSVPQPSFLDERNAILLADQALNHGANRDVIWTTFANRGMGFFAGSADSSDIAPAEDFHAPPAAGTPTGAIAGTIRSATSGLPLAGVRVALGGLNSGQFGFEDTTDSAGRYRIDGVPQGTYTRLAFLPSAGVDQVAQPVAVSGGTTTTVNAEMRRDWSALSGGAHVVDTNDDTGGPFGCGVDQAIDQSRGVGWSAFNPTGPDYPSPPLDGNPPHMTVALPAAISVLSFGIDPSNTCGDGPSAGVKHIRVETAASASGPFTVALDHTFNQATDEGRLNLVPAAGGTANVRFVRVTLLAPFNDGIGFSGRDFIDLTEFEVFGDTPNRLPAGPLKATPSSARVGQSVQFDASQVKDPDSAIVRYRWDFDGNGTIDQTTTGPVTGTAYAARGTYTARVIADDFRGGSGEASTTVTVTGPAAPALRPPRFTRFRTGKHGVSFRVLCDSSCSVRGKLVVSKRVARKLRLKSRTVGTLSRKASANRRTRLTLGLKSSVLRAMRRHGVRSFKATMTLSAKDAERQVTRARTRHPRFRR